MNSTNLPSTTKHRPYLHEVDFMRVFFICGVLFNHTLNKFTEVMTSQSGWPYYDLKSIRMMFHFSRMGFMFMSGLVLTLNYFERNDWLTFFKKRYNGTLWPYLIWNFLLMLLTIVVSDISYASFSNHYLTAIIHGSSFYMYYLLVTLQLYLVFPGIVWLFKKWPNAHKRIVVISFFVQIILVSLIKFKFANMDTGSWPYWFKSYSINVFSYQFYFIFGAFTSLHYQYTVDFIRRHIQAIGISAMLLSIGTIGYFRIWNLKILGLANDQATSPHQPYMLFFDFLTICTIFFVGKQYEAWRDNGMPEWLTTGVSRIAKVSFGMYLNQTIILMILKWLLSMLSVPDWVLLFMLPLGWLSVVYGSFTFAWFCYKVPPFGFLIGRPNFSVRKVVLKQS